jgi:hypothetical protein
MKIIFFLAWNRAADGTSRFMLWARSSTSFFFIRCNNLNSFSLPSFIPTNYPSSLSISPSLPSSPLPCFPLTLCLFDSFYQTYPSPPHLLHTTCTTSHTTDDDDTHTQSSSISSSRRARALEARKSIIVSTVDGSIKYRSWEFDPRSHRSSGDS